MRASPARETMAARTRGPASGSQGVRRWIPATYASRHGGIGTGRRTHAPTTSPCPSYSPSTLARGAERWSSGNATRWHASARCIYTRDAGKAPVMAYPVVCLADRCIHRMGVSVKSLAPAWAREASNESYSGGSSSTSRQRARAKAGTERSRCTILVDHARVFSSDLLFSGTKSLHYCCCCEATRVQCCMRSCKVHRMRDRPTRSGSPARPREEKARKP